MITDPQQAQALIQSTEDLIAEDGMSISLNRVTWIETPSGGVRRDGEATPQPAVRRFFGAVRSDPPRIIREEGEQLLLRHVLVGMPGDDIQEKDTFSIDGRDFEIVEVDPEDTWQRKGWAVERD